jgi:hypothetical protein
MLPILLAEALIRPFKFFHDGQMLTGAYYRDGLYGLVYQFDPQSRTKVYQLGCELVNQGVPVIITASETHYAIWIGLHSSFYRNWLAAEQPALTSLLSGGTAPTWEEPTWGMAQQQVAVAR